MQLFLCLGFNQGGREKKEKTASSRSPCRRVRSVSSARKTGSGSPGKRKRSLARSSRDRGLHWKSFGKSCSRKIIKGSIFRERQPAISGKKINMGNSARKTQARKTLKRVRNGNVANEEKAPTVVPGKKIARSAKKKSLVKEEVFVRSATEERCAKRRKKESPCKTVKGENLHTMARNQPAVITPSYLQMAYAAFPRHPVTKKKDDCISSAPKVRNMSKIQKDGKSINTSRKQQMTYIPSYVRLDDGARNIRPVVKRRSVSLPTRESNGHMSEMPIDQSTTCTATNIRPAQNTRSESLSATPTVRNRSKTVKEKDLTTSVRDWHTSSIPIDHPPACTRRVKKKNQDETFSKVPRNVNTLNIVQKVIRPKKADDGYQELLPNDQHRTNKATHVCNTSRRNINSAMMKDDDYIVDPQEDLYMSNRATNVQQPRSRRCSRPAMITREQHTANASIKPHMSIQSNIMPPTSRWKFQNTFCMTNPILEGAKRRQQSVDLNMDMTASNSGQCKRRRSPSTNKSSSHRSTTPDAPQSVQRWRFHKDFWNTPSTTEDTQQRNQSPGQKTAEKQHMASTQSQLCTSYTPLITAPVQRWKFHKDFWPPTANQEESQQRHQSPVRRIRKGKNGNAGDGRMLKRVKISLLTQSPSQDSSIVSQQSPSNCAQVQVNSKGKHCTRPRCRNKASQSSPDF